MKTQTITLRLDKVSLSREMSRDAFKSMPKQRSIGNKKLKPPKHKPDWREEQ